MTIYLASDHAGFQLKEKIKVFLEKSGYTVKDFGASTFKSDDDYPDYMKKAAVAVAKDPHARAIIFGGSGQGEAIVVNRYKKVRAAVYYGGTNKIVTLSREHNNANVLSIGARFVSETKAKQVILLWLKTVFSKEKRHVRRLKKF